MLAGLSWLTRSTAILLAVLLVALAGYSLANASDDSTAPGSRGLVTKFEQDFPAVAWNGAPLFTTNVDHASCRIIDGTGVDDSPALIIAGADVSPERSHVYFTLFETQLPVTEHMVLRYRFRPSNKLGQHTSIDLLFADGTTLRDSTARDQDQRPMHPGESKGEVGKWTTIECPIGKHLQGKTIKAVLAAYDHAPATGSFSAAFDNLEIRTYSASEREEIRLRFEHELEAKRDRMKPPVLQRSWPSIEAYRVSRPNAATVSSAPIRTDIKHAITQGVWALNHSFDRDRDEEPYFYANRRADGFGEFHHAKAIGVPHVVGRALWASMLAEETAKVPFPPEGLQILTRYCKSSFDNEDHLNSYNDPERGNQRFVEFHNMREGLLGLVALMRGRDDDWAKEEARQMLITLEKLTDADGRWTMEQARTIGMAERCSGIGNDATGCGRFVGALMEYYQFTHDPRAKALAEKYARATLETAFTPKGEFAPMKSSGGHVHSITSSLSGITLYAIRAADQEMLQQCRQIMDQGVPAYHSSWGWGDEVTPEHPANVVSRGEMNQTGDVIRTALLLGSQGDSRYYELAERYLRGMLLPTQHDEVEMQSYLNNRPNPQSDAERDVRHRIAGGFAMQLPNDRMRQGDWPLSTLDITSGAVHALCECWRHRVTADADIAKVNLLFDYQGDSVVITSYLPKQGRITFQAGDCKTLLIRVPSWVDHGTIRVTVNDSPRERQFENGYLMIAGLESGVEGDVMFDVPVKVEKETVDGVEYTTTWLGSQIIEILPRGRVSPLPY